ncbi:protein of unknown function [Rhodovastum atsumiense]|nr:protein of unknown function [Rhodovastum atsumiense]
MPSGMRARMLPRYIGTAQAMPGMLRTRCTWMSDSALMSSTYWAWLSVTHMSTPPMLSMNTVVRERMCSMVAPCCATSSVVKPRASTMPRYFARSPASIFQAMRSILRNRRGPGEEGDTAVAPGGAGWRARDHVARGEAAVPLPGRIYAGLSPDPDAGSGPRTGAPGGIAPFRPVPPRPRSAPALGPVSDPLAGAGGGMRGGNDW